MPTPMRSRGAGVDTGDLRDEETGSEPGDVRRRGRRESPPEDLGPGDPCDERSGPHDVPMPSARAGGSNLTQEVGASGGYQLSSRRRRQYGELAGNEHTRRWRCRPPRRVAGEHYCSPAPSERHVTLSVYAAQASLKAPRGTRWGASAPPARYWSGADERNTPETAPAASCCHRLCLPSQLLRRSRAETPEGSQPALTEGDLAPRLNPYVG